MNDTTENQGDRFYGVTAPSWASDEGLVNVLRSEAETVPTDRDRALLLTAADRIDKLVHEIMAYQVSNGYEQGYDHGQKALADHLLGTLKVLRERRPR